MEEDLLELQQFYQQAQRITVKNILKKEMTVLQKRIDDLKVQEELEKQKIPQKIEEVKLQTTEDNLKYLTLDKYSFEQEGGKIKVYFFLDNIGDIPKESVIGNFQSNSLELRILGYKGVNYKWGIPRLFDSIKTDNAKVIHKQNRITLILEKTKSKHWDQIMYKEVNKSKIEEDKKVKEDPQAGIMNMMKKMYDEGDDEMKRTIGKAWTEAQSKKGGGGMEGMGGMGM